MDIVLATGNKDKVKEIKAYFKDLHINLLSLKNFTNVPEIIEDGDTLEANAIKKAKTISLFTSKPALADDTGLEVAALDKRPGVYSARYAGEDATYNDNTTKLLNELKNIPLNKRTADFKTVIALFYPDGKFYTVEGKCSGIITTEKKGQNGFGYDPIFLVPDLGKTFAEMSLEEKNKISHRANALKKMKEFMSRIL